MLPKNEICIYGEVEFYKILGVCIENLCFLCFLSIYFSKKYVNT